jgi:hypothetical protein
MKNGQYNFTQQIRFAKSLCGHLPKPAIHALEELLQRQRLSVTNGDVKYLEGNWYVTHAGLLRLAQRRRCAGIHSRPVLEASNPQAGVNLDSGNPGLLLNSILHFIKFLPDEQRHILVEQIAEKAA